MSLFSDPPLKPYATYNYNSTPTYIILDSPAACVFPFELNGHSYNGCIYNQNGLEPWCPTQLDELGFPTASRPCVQGDPIEQTTCSVKPSSLRTKCIFPFKYLGKTYSECTLDDDTEPWCATALNLFGDMVDGKKALCGDDCNVLPPANLRYNSLLRTNERMTSRYFSYSSSVCQASTLPSTEVYKCNTLELLWN